jgi:hypothetical protein
MSDTDASHGSNGVDETPVQKKNTETTYTEYKLEDFSQQKINLGQQQINGLIRETAEMVIDTFKQVRTWLTTLDPKDQGNLRDLNAAIDKLTEATKAIAGPFPPGCGSYPP